MYKHFVYNFIFQTLINVSLYIWIYLLDITTVYFIAIFLLSTIFKYGATIANRKSVKLVVLICELLTVVINAIVIALLYDYTSVFICSILLYFCTLLCTIYLKKSDYVLLN